MSICFYIISIILANIVTATFAPIHLWLFIIPYGTLLIGLTFVLRDLVQERYGRKKTYLVIGFGLALSAITSLFIGDVLTIVVASAISFLISESTDTEIYTRLKLPLKFRIFWSGVGGGTLDSIVFVIIGLSPLSTNILPWEAVPMAILGQIIVKTIMQFIGIGIIGVVPFKKRLRDDISL